MLANILQAQETPEREEFIARSTFPWLGARCNASARRRARIRHIRIWGLVSFQQFSDTLRHERVVGHCIGWGHGMYDGSGAGNRISCGRHRAFYSWRGQRWQRRIFGLRGSVPSACNRHPHHDCRSSRQRRRRINDRRVGHRPSSRSGHHRRSSWRSTAQIIRISDHRPSPKPRHRPTTILRWPFTAPRSSVSPARTQDHLRRHRSRRSDSRHHGLFIHARGKTRRLDVVHVDPADFPHVARNQHDLPAISTGPHCLRDRYLVAVVEPGETQRKAARHAHSPDIVTLIVSRFSSLQSSRHLAYHPARR